MDILPMLQLLIKNLDDEKQALNTISSNNLDRW
jgi:hypothetical protein